MALAFSSLNQINGTADDDTINLAGVSTTGPQAVSAGAGDDKVIMNGVSGLANGGEGNDTLIGNHGRDTLKGDEGDDLVRGEGGSDKIFGQEGNDTLYGGADNDSIFGGADEDVIIGGNGNDILSGDDRANPEAADTFVFDNADGNDRILDFDDLDSIVLIGDGSEDFTITYQAGNSLLTYGSTTVQILGFHIDAGDVGYADATDFPFA